VTGGLFLMQKFTAAGVSLRGAQIGQAIICDDAVFGDARRLACTVFDADGLIARGVFFRKSKVFGELRLVVARIAGNLLMDGAQLEAHDMALNASGITVDGYLILGRGFTAQGTVHLPGANLGSTMNCEGAVFNNPGKIALMADRLNIKGGVFLRSKFEANGAVSLSNAQIGGGLDCAGAVFRNPQGRHNQVSSPGSSAVYQKTLKGVALTIGGATIGGSVLLRNDFSAAGEVIMTVAEIGRNLDCRKGKFDAGGSPRALNAVGVQVHGYGILRDGFEANGEVWLAGANIQLDLSCAGGKFFNPKGIAIVGDALTVNGSVFLGSGSENENERKPVVKQFEARGEARFEGAHIERNLECRGAVFDNLTGTALSLKGAEIGGDLVLNQLFSRPKGTMDLRGTHAARFIDDAASWPSRDALCLDGFVYDTLAGESPTWAKDKKGQNDEEGQPGRLAWLALESATTFKPQPYEQLVSVFRTMGKDEDARQIAIEKRRRELRSGQLALGSRIWNLFLGVTIGYGYRVWMAAVWMAGVIIVSGFIFNIGFNHHLITASKEPASTNNTNITATNNSASPEATTFHPWLYSLDTFLPFVELDQKTSWKLHPLRARNAEFWLFEAYFILHMLLGWVLIGALGAGLTGLVKTE
jgi:hypothetical protein